MAKVFISYRSSDQEQVRRLAADLRDRGHEVWFDEWEIKVGDSIVERIAEGLETADYLVLCLSGRSTQSPWVDREGFSTLARKLNGHDVGLLPAIFEGGELPAILADLRYADFRTNWSVGLRALLGGIR